MKFSFFRVAGVVLLVLSVAAASGAQEGPPEGGGQAGPRMGMGGMFANGAHGTVTAISGNEITIKDEQGEVFKVETGPNTHFRKNREEAKISDVHAGDVIVAAGNLDSQAKTVGAVFVIVLDAQQAARMEKMRADFGKTWTVGRVTAIKDLTVTIDRPDHVSQTIAVDENTIFEKRGRGTSEDITFPDIKVGDMVRAGGALANGSFLAKTVAVMERGPRRFGAGGPGSAARPAAQPEGTPSDSAPAQAPNGQQN